MRGQQGPRSAVLVLVCAAAVLTGCGSVSRLDVAFRAHVIRVCGQWNTASPVTRFGYAKQQRQAGMDFATLGRVHPPTGGERQTYRDLLMHVSRVHAFFERNESGVIAIDRMTARPRRLRAVLRRVQRFYRPIAVDQSAILDDTSALHLDGCQILIGG